MSAAVGLIVLVGRILFSVQFLQAALFHLRSGEQAVGYSRHMGFPVPALASWPSGLWLLAGGLSVLLGIWPDLGALMVAIWVIPTAWWFHAYWKVEDQQQAMTARQLFYRNLTYLGAALILFGTFVALGPELRYTITGPVFSF